LRANNTMRGYEKVSIDLIRVGDVVFFEDKDRTVGKSNIKGDSFMGRTLWGDSYHSGYKPVLRKIMNNKA